MRTHVVGRKAVEEAAVEEADVGLRDLSRVCAHTYVAWGHTTYM
jgi:hypothetical protein